MSCLLSTLASILTYFFLKLHRYCELYSSYISFGSSQTLLDKHYVDYFSDQKTQFVSERENEIVQVAIN